MDTNSNKSRLLESCIGAARELKNLIDYSDDSVVSKTILDKKVGTITLFAFDKGQGLSEHTSPYDAVVQIIDGLGQFKIGKTEVPAKEGQILIMPANIPHAVKAVEKFKMLLTMIKSN